MSTPLDECTATFTTLSDFLTATAEYLSGSGEMPAAIDLLTAFDYSTSLEELVQRSNQAAAFQNGAIQESIATMVSVTREVDLATRGKASLFLSAAADAQAEQEYYTQTGQFLVGVMRGAATNGSQC